MKEFNLSEKEVFLFNRKLVGGKWQRAIPTKDVKEFIKLNSEISEEEGKDSISEDTFQEGFMFAVNRLKRTSGKKLSGKKVNSNKGWE